MEQKNPSKQKKIWTPVDQTEMDAVIGLLITAGAQKVNREPMRFLCCKNPLYCRHVDQYLPLQCHTINLVKFFRI